MQMGDQRPDQGTLFSTNAEAVIDKFHSAYFLMYLIGVGSLFAWNAFITPINYWELRLHGSLYERSFESILTSTFTLFSLMTILFIQRHEKMLSLRFRIIFSLLLLIAVFGWSSYAAIAPLSLDNSVLVQRLRDGSEGQFYTLIVSGALAGVGQAILTGAAMEYASLFGQPHYIQAVSGGQGVAGLTVTLGSLFIALPGMTKQCGAASPPSPPALLTAPFAAPHPYTDRLGAAMTPEHARDVVGSAVIYFCGTVGVLCCCLIGFFAIERLPFTRARKRIARRHAEEAVTGKPAEFDDREGNWGRGDYSPPPIEASTPHMAMLRRQSTLMSPSPGRRKRESEAPIFPMVWRWAAALTMVYTVSIAIFPSLTASLFAVDDSSCMWQHLFTPLTFVVFNIGDTIGRNLPCHFKRSQTTLLVACCRWLFAPLFMMCHTDGPTTVFPGIFDVSNWSPLLTILLFAITNGWLTTTVYVSSMNEVPASQRGRNAGLLTCFLNTGIFFGAALSFFIRYLDCKPTASNGYDCNPFITTGNASLGADSVARVAAW